MANKKDINLAVMSNNMKNAERQRPLYSCFSTPEFSEARLDSIHSVQHNDLFDN